MTLREYVNQPFPYPGSKWIKNVLFLSAFISFFLLIFQPIDGALPYKQFILAGFGFVSFLTGFLLHITCLPLFPRMFDEDTWTIKKHLLWFAVQLFFIGITNHYYSVYFIPSHPKGIEGLLLFQLRAFGLGIFPITIHVIITHNYLLSKNLKETIEINRSLSTPVTPRKARKSIRLISDNEKDAIELYISDLVFIESVGNYIQVYIIQKGIVKNSVLRCSLKRAEAILSDYVEVVKCHRAYLVNVRNVSSVKGNSLGYRLCFGNCEKEIPVARNYAKILKEQLEFVHSPA